jgi:hypothetical protein
VLSLLVAVFLLARTFEQTRDRRRVLAEARARHPVATPEPTPTPDDDDTGIAALELEELPPLFDPWYRDAGIEPRYCAFDLDVPQDGVLRVHTQRFENGMTLLLSEQDLAFVVWTAVTYQLNPHFLLGIMMTESAGDCSAVSSAGAQGCFQITYRQGAGQLKNSFAERVDNWYWAPRISGSSVSRRPGEALGYWPADLYIPPETYFGRKLRKGTRQLRMTPDPAANLQTSDRAGDTLVSSVANFSFGVIGAALYFHFLNYYLYAHETQLKGDVFDLVGMPGMKVRWMAASYNEGAPRSMRQLGNYGPAKLKSVWSGDVLAYTERVTDYCEQLQQGKETYSGKMSWPEFSDWLDQLRWTYSFVNVDWLGVREMVQKRFFMSDGKSREIDLERELVPIFRAMQAFDPRLGPEQPRLDHRVRF